MQKMDQEDALTEIERLKSEHRSKRRAYYAANREHKRAMSKAWRERNKKKVRKYAKRVMERIYADPERHAAHKAADIERKRKQGVYGIDRTTPEKHNAKQRRYRQRCKTKHLAQTNPAEMRKLIRVHVPGYLMAAAQMDVINSVMVQVLDRKVPFNELAAWVKKSVTEYNRQFDHFKNVSIDAPIAGTEGLTRADLIDSEAFHF
ncbi:hypothetical protein ABE527_18365 [Brucella sp. TWI432]